MTVIAGTFSGTGNSSETTLTGKAVVHLSFAGTATVNIQIESAAGNWVTESSKTASGVFFYDFEPWMKMRLNYSAHTNDVIYSLEYVPSEKMRARHHGAAV